MMKKRILSVADLLCAYVGLCGLCFCFGGYRKGEQSGSFV